VAAVGESSSSTLEQVARIVRASLEAGKSIEIDRLGIFRSVEAGRFEFIPNQSTSIFIAYVEEDLALAETLYDRLEAEGFAPWMDRRDLLPGQNWPRSIERSIEVSDFFVALLSRKSLVKRSVFQSELRYALDCARRQPLDSVFIIPLRIEPCDPPSHLAQHLHHVDLFPNFAQGVQRVVTMIRKELARRKRL